VAETGVTGPFSVSGMFLHGGGSISSCGFRFGFGFISGICFVFEGGLISGRGCNTRSPFIKDCGFISRFR
jgi:hypothetical protein